MKRISFLTAAAAAALSGCGRHGGGSGVVPAVGSSSVRRASDYLPADPIPKQVLEHPILGEVRRYDGAVPPPGWVIAQGQTMPISQNRALFAILGKSGGGDGKTMIKLPNPQHAQFIIAVVGVVPQTPRALAALRPGPTVSVAGPVIERQGYRAVPKLNVPDGRPLWAPGTFLTPEQIEAQAASARAAVPVPARSGTGPRTF